MRQKNSSLQNGLHTSTVQHHHAYLTLSWVQSPINSELIHATSLTLCCSLTCQCMPWQGHRGPQPSSKSPSNRWFETILTAHEFALSPNKMVFISHRALAISRHWFLYLLWGYANILSSQEVPCQYKQSVPASPRDPELVIPTLCNDKSSLSLSLLLKQMCFCYQHHTRPFSLAL